MYRAVAANKRNTVLIMAVFVALVVGIGFVAQALLGDGSGVILGATIIGALIYVVIQYYQAGSQALAMAGARQIQKKDNPRLYRIVENLAITTGLPTPKVYIVDDPAPNAFATGRDPEHAAVAATTGLLELMDDQELGVSWPTKWRTSKTWTSVSPPSFLDWSWSSVSSLTSLLAWPSLADCAEIMAAGTPSSWWSGFSR